MVRKIKAMVAAVTLVVIGTAIFANVASAECGPGFTSKQQLIRYYKHNHKAAHGFRKELLAHKKYTGYQADETVLNWLRSPEQKVFKAPAGYRLTYNTYCPSGPGHYQPYDGLLSNMGGKPMLWHCAKGVRCVPILKGYCMNFVCGPAVNKHKPAHKHKCRCRKPKKVKKPKPAPSCEAKGLVTGPAGSCVNQSAEVKATQGCEADNHSNTGCTQNTITIVTNCSNVAVGNEGNVGQAENCQTGGESTCVGQDNCNVTPPPEEHPCGCKPESSIKITSTTELNMIAAGKTSGDFNIGTYASESGGVLTVDPGIGGVSLCNSAIPKGSVTINVPAGASEQCVIFYAPEDADKPASMTVTMNACLGSICDEKTQTFKLTYPIRS